MVIDYPRSVSRFTQLDAHPLPKIDEVVNNDVQDKFYSYVDLRTAYYQVPIREDERPYPAFEATGSCTSTRDSLLALRMRYLSSNGSSIVSFAEIS